MFVRTFSTKTAWCGYYEQFHKNNFYSGKRPKQYQLPMQYYSQPYIFCNYLIWAVYIHSLNGNTQVRVNPGPKWWWALKMGQWPISYSKTCRLHNFNRPFEISMAPLQSLMGPRILNIYILEHNWHDLWIAYIWGPAKNNVHLAEIIAF